MDLSVTGKDVCCRLKNNLCYIMIVKLRGLGLSFWHPSKHAAS